MDHVADTTESLTRKRAWLEDARERLVRNEESLEWYKSHPWNSPAQRDEVLALTQAHLTSGRDFIAYLEAQLAAQPSSSAGYSSGELFAQTDLTRAGG
jgi:hypothetical protein